MHGSACRSRTGAVDARTAMGPLRSILNIWHRLTRHRLADRRIPLRPLGTSATDGDSRPGVEWVLVAHRWSRVRGGWPHRWSWPCPSGTGRSSVATSPGRLWVPDIASHYPMACADPLGLSVGGRVGAAGALGIGLRAAIPATSRVARGGAQPCALYPLAPCRGAPEAPSPGADRPGGRVAIGQCLLGGPQPEWAHERPACPELVVGDHRPAPVRGGPVVQRALAGGGAHRGAQHAGGGRLAAAHAHPHRHDHPAARGRPQGA